jgi:hypothetical protein
MKKTKTLFASLALLALLALPAMGGDQGMPGITPVPTPTPGAGGNGIQAEQTMPVDEAQVADANVSESWVVMVLDGINYAALWIF